MQNKVIQQIYAIALVATVLSVLTGCVVGSNVVTKPSQPNVPPFPFQTVQPINIEVIDQRPAQERVKDPNNSSGYAYTTYNAETQAKAFGDGMGVNLRLGKAIPEYNNINAKQAPAPFALNFKFVLKHWYGRWPLNEKRTAILVEGECETSLEISRNGKIIFTGSYYSKGIPQFASMVGINNSNYGKYIVQNIDRKADDVNVRVIGAFIDDMRKNRATIVNAEKI